MAVTYKCPSCGAAMEFDSDSQTLKCTYCDTQISVNEYKDIFENESIKNESNQMGKSAKKQFAESKKNLTVYSCQSCGAQLITDEFTTAVICSFCGNPSLVEDRITEDVPSLVIPFKIGREKAVEIYRNWLKKAPLLPNQLSKSGTVEKISGLYVPYWLYDLNASEYLEAAATRTRTQSDGNYNYIYTDHYKIIRDTYAEFDKVPADASSKMEDDLMDRLEPFDYAEMVKFEMPYLSGYLSEKYNYTAKELESRPREKAKRYITALTRDTIKGYSGVTVTENRVQLQNRREEYALLPVWVLNYRYKNKEFQFVINGQTGKVVTDRPPISGKKTAVWGSLVFASVFVISLIGGFLIL